jgi:nucleoside-diphosphate-sugar epimerase
MDLARRESPSDLNLVGVGSEDVDLRDRTATSRVLSQIKPRRIIHLAAKLTKGEGPEVLREQMEHTFLAGTVLLDSALEVGVEHVLIAGTLDEFGSREGELRTTDAAEPGSYYGLSKSLLREYAAFVARRSAMRIDWFRPFLVYGPGQVARNMLLPIAFRAAKSGETAKFSDGFQKRDFIHVEDVAAWLLGALRISLSQAPLGLQLHHLGTGNPISVRAVLQAIEEEFPSAKFELGAVPRRLADPSVQIAPTYKSAEPSLKDWHPRFDWRAGIAQTAGWWKSRDEL